MLLRSAIVASVLLGSSLAAAAGPAAAVVPVKAQSKARPAAKKKAPAPRAPATTQPPLTAEQLGLGEYKLSSIKAAEQGEVAPAAPAPVPAPAPAPAPAATPEPSPKLELGNKDKVIAPRAEAPRRFSIELNPLSAGVGRYGLNVEVVPFVHHALIGSAFYQTFQPYVLERIMPKVVDTSHGAPAKLGGELGYRFYSGRRGANGFFIGASGVLMPMALPRVTPDLKADVASFYAYGGAVDVGIQGITDSGFTIGAGIGGMYLAYNAPESAKMPPGVPPVKYYEPHFLPRVLLAAGWSF